MLKAFQDYIEAERAQARKRVMQLSVFYAVLMGVVVTGFLTAGIFMLRNMSDVQTKLLDVALANKIAPVPQPTTPTTIVQSSPAFEESVKQMTRVTSELQSSMDKKLDGVNELTSKVHEKVASQDSELAKLRSELHQMQEQSTKLNNELNTMKTETRKAAMTTALPAPVVASNQQPVNAPIIAPAPTVAIAPTAVVAPVSAQMPASVSAKVKPPAQDPRFPPAVKDPPVKPVDVTPPAPPPGMMAMAIPLKTKHVGTVPWRVLIPE